MPALSHVIRGRGSGRPEQQYEAVDLAIVAESTYPYLLGGVSAVIHEIVKANPDRSIGIIHISWDSNCPAKNVYEVPPNVKWVYPVFLSMNDHVEDFKQVSVSSLDLSSAGRQEISERIFAALDALMSGDESHLWELYDRTLNPRTRDCPLWGVLATQEFMSAALTRYRGLRMSFTDLFWLLREFFSLTCAIAGTDYPKAQIYHSHTTGYAGLLAAVAARQNGGRMLLTEHNLYTRDTINEMLDRNMSTVVTAADWHADSEVGETQRVWMAWYTEIGRLIYRAADRITYLYPAAIDEAAGLGSDAAKSEIIPNGMLLEKFEPARAQFLRRRMELRNCEDRPAWRLAYCARLVPIKGLIDLISSVSHLVKSGVTNFTLDVMGHAEELPDYAAKCYQLASALDLGDHIQFRGSQNLAEVLGDFDMLILPSYNEGQPMVVLEAMAVGLPVIGTPVGGMEQLILSALADDPGSAPGPCGLLVAPGDVAGLAEAVQTLTGDPAMYHFLSENSRNRVAQYFVLDRAMEAYRLIYGELENAAQPGPGVPRPRSGDRPRWPLLRALGRPATVIDASSS
jgi:glycosyltransferase involved in cell wall biosynthesis